MRLIIAAFLILLLILSCTFIKIEGEQHKTAIHLEKTAEISSPPKK